MLYGYHQIETPAMENLSTLMGKYGDEGDQLIFKILNSGDYLSKTTADDREQGAQHLMPKISEKGLRYDLTVPFARHVAMNKHELTFPFKRYQIQPVWRADRPQKGRYREFYQCDADVVGTDSLLCEAEFLSLIHAVLDELGITEFEVLLNSRKILTGLSELLGAPDKMGDLAVALDKWDKIGSEKVMEELKEKGFKQEGIQQLDNLLGAEANPFSLEYKLPESGLKGLHELKEIISKAEKIHGTELNIKPDARLARGLNYYTGAIIELKVNNVKIGSIGGGGRYDDLTGIFGLSGLSGVGFSFGIDRIYDVLEELNVFDDKGLKSTDVLIANFGEEAEEISLDLLAKIRKSSFSAELYPDHVRMKKQFSYADKKNIPWVIIPGPEELADKQVTLKNMQSGEQNTIVIDNIIDYLIKSIR